MIFTFNTWALPPSPLEEKKTWHVTPVKTKTKQHQLQEATRLPGLPWFLRISIYILYIYTMFHASFLVGEKWPLDRGLLGDWFSDLLDSKSSESHLSERKLFLDQLALWLVVDLDVQSYPWRNLSILLEGRMSFLITFLRPKSCRQERSLVNWDPSPPPGGKSFFGVLVVVVEGRLGSPVPFPVLKKMKPKPNK